MPELAQIAADLETRYPPKHTVCVGLGDWSARVETNSALLAEKLAAYFRPWAVKSGDVRILALQCDEPQSDIDFADWPREPGKSGRKEEFADISGGRVIRKVRTGMRFLLGSGHKVAFGPCEANDNQVVNFVNTQLINWLLARDWALCHASAVVYRERGLMFAGLAGGGKSTLALHLMSRGARFTSNDRLLVRHEDGAVRMTGVPKLPRINPGTILHNPDLDGTIPEPRLSELRALDPSALWNLEEKYDADISRCFGPDRFAPAARVQALVVLNWDRNSPEPTRLVPADLTKRDDLLGAVMKSPGPFHETADGEHPDRKPDVNPELYAPHLPHVPAFELTGRADFDAAIKQVEALIDTM